MISQSAFGESRGVRRGIQQPTDEVTSFRGREKNSFPSPRAFMLAAMSIDDNARVGMPSKATARAAEGTFQLIAQKAIVSLSSRLRRPPRKWRAACARDCDPALAIYDERERERR